MSFVEAESLITHLLKNWLGANKSNHCLLGWPLYHAISSQTLLLLSSTPNNASLRLELARGSKLPTSLQAAVENANRTVIR